MFGQSAVEHHEESEYDQLFLCVWLVFIDAAVSFVIITLHMGIAIYTYTRQIWGIYKLY